MLDVIARAACPGWEVAEEYLSEADPILGELIAHVGHCTLAPRRDYFAALCQSIINQQISTIAARSVWEKFRRLFPRCRVSPALVGPMTDETLRAAGLSRQKASYLRSLAGAFTDGSIPVRKLAKLDDEAIVQALIPVRGIGRWTAEMFLIFVLNRTDVLPVDDLGLCTQAQKLYGLKAYPKAKEMTALAERWRPYRSVATWYLWRAGWK